jgi:hypothetical protein
LPKKRTALQAEVRALIKKYGPPLGALYFENEVAWDQVMKKLREDGEEEEESRNLENSSEANNSQTGPGFPQSLSSADFSVSPMENDEVMSSADPELLNKKTL